MCRLSRRRTIRWLLSKKPICCKAPSTCSFLKSLLSVPSTATASPSVSGKSLLMCCRASRALSIPLSIDWKSAAGSPPIGVNRKTIARPASIASPPKAANNSLRKKKPGPGFPKPSHSFFKPHSRRGAMSESQPSPTPGDDSIDREIAHHINTLTDAYMAQGISPEEARRRALVEFGGREQVRQTVREVHVSAFAESIAFHLKAALRFLRKSPSFSLAVILTLALGIGANSAVFSAIDAIVLRPLPFPNGDRLNQINQPDSKSRDANHFVAPVRLEDWNRLNSTFQSISGYYLDDLSETSGQLPERVTEALVAPRFLQVMGVAPILGREFTPQEEHWGGPDSILISYGFWQRRFHGDPDAIGKNLHIGSFSYTIIGVMPASFQFPNRDVDLWAPSAPDAPFAKRRDATWFTVIGRLKPNTSIQQATADLLTVQNQLGKQFAKPDNELTVQTTPLKEVVVGGVRSSLWLLYGSVSLLLLIRF